MGVLVELPEVLNDPESLALFLGYADPVNCKVSLTVEPLLVLAICPGSAR